MSIPPPIILPPSTSTTELVNAIEQAAATGATLKLQPGTHFTRPGRLQHIAVGANGLRIESTGPSPLPLSERTKKARIQRPDHAVPLATPDDNYGLFFIPDAPTDRELAGVTWKPFTDAHGNQFEFTILMRGELHLSRLLVDCNMQNQGLENLADKHAAEHSAMLGFSGWRYPAPPGPGGVKRRVYIGFERVTLQEMGFVNGGYADDVWVVYGGGAFHPHIEHVVIENVASAQRIENHRATLSFSGLAHQIRIHDADVYRVHAEQDGDWKDAPRRDATFSNSVWDLAQIKAERMAFSVKGKVVTLAAKQLAVSSIFQVNFAGGVIADSTLRVANGQDARFFRLDNLHFDRVTWQLPANANGVVRGILPSCRFNDTCIATFTDNRFTAIGSVNSGQLIGSAYSTTEPGNRVQLSFAGCSYDAAFGTAALPQTCIARVNERGTWTFRATDLGGRDPEQALPKGNHLDVVRILT
jgi:hypothetical protein